MRDMDHTLETHCLAIEARRSFIDRYRGLFGRIENGDGAIIEVIGVHLTYELPDELLAKLGHQRAEACLIIEVRDCEDKPRRRLADRHRRVVLPTVFRFGDAEQVPVHYLHDLRLRPH